MILGGPVSQVADEGFDQISAGFAEFLRAAEFGCVALDQGRIELMLTDQEAQSITKPRMSVARVIPIRMRLSGSISRGRLTTRGEVSKFLD